ncbi:hypothetical protein C1645_833283 [Glomus cerebriforme]|uniref:Endonuclease/exonuclease/phosphatase domain-containing protein n=1 Tax=Glomus cerebriforme TaxID=658196 RepID=A0A397SFW4_9GLOM|nr:hypothetical protein C1645_833283 [Glomus cerebriforme]
MLMGDFNLKYEEFIKNYKRKGIDAIWVSSNLLLDTLTADNFPIDLFNTDHHSVSTTMIRQGLFNQNANICKLIAFLPDIYNHSTLNSAWNEIRKNIMDSANKYINNHFSSTEHKQEFRLKYISTLSGYIRALNTFLKLISADKVSNNSAFLTNNNKNWIEKIISLRKTLLVLYESQVRTDEDKRIKEFVKSRCDNYKDNQGLMLDSLLE